MFAIVSGGGRVVGWRQAGRQAEREGPYLDRAGTIQGRPLMPPYCWPGFVRQPEPATARPGGQGAGNFVFGKRYAPCVIDTERVKGAWFIRHTQSYHQKNPLKR